MAFVLATAHSHSGHDLGVRVYSQYAAEGPDVHLVAVALLAQHLRCDVVGCPTQGLLPLAIKLNLSGQTKVPWERPNVVEGLLPTHAEATCTLTHMATIKTWKSSLI